MCLLNAQKGVLSFFKRIESRMTSCESLDQWTRKMSIKYLVRIWRSWLNFYEKLTPFSELIIHIRTVVFDITVHSNLKMAKLVVTSLVFPTWATCCQVTTFLIFYNHLSMLTCILKVNSKVYHMKSASSFWFIIFQRNPA